MKVATCTLKSISAYSQSRSYSHEIEKPETETHADYETRTWRNKCHTNKDGYIVIPPMAFKMGLDTAAKMLSQKIPGKRNSTYTKYFKSGVLCMEGPVLSVTSDKVERDRIFANSDGVRGSGRRVWKIFPRVDTWEAIVDFHILADEITNVVFEQHLKKAGAFIGIGRFRPENGGYYGRFEVSKIKWG